MRADFLRVLPGWYSIVVPDSDPVPTVGHGPGAATTTETLANTPLRGVPWSLSQKSRG